MPANDKFLRISPDGTIPITTTLSVSKGVGDTSISVRSTQNWNTTNPVPFAIYLIDSQGRKREDTQGDYIGQVANATTINEVKFTGGVERAYSVGTNVKVEVIGSAELFNRLHDGLTAEHDKEGSHTNINATSVRVGGRPLQPVVANPGGATSAVLQSIQIGTTNLSVPRGGTTSGGTTTAPSEYTEVGRIDVDHLPPAASGGGVDLTETQRRNQANHVYTRSGQITTENSDGFLSLTADLGTILGTTASRYWVSDVFTNSGKFATADLDSARSGVVGHGNFPTTIYGTTEGSHAGVALWDERIVVAKRRSSTQISLLFGTVSYDGTTADINGIDWSSTIRNITVPINLVAGDVDVALNSNTLFVLAASTGGDNLLLACSMSGSNKNTTITAQTNIPPDAPRPTFLGENIDANANNLVVARQGSGSTNFIDVYSISGSGSRATLTFVSSTDISSSIPDSERDTTTGTTVYNRVGSHTGGIALDSDTIFIGFPYKESGANRYKMFLWAAEITATTGTAVITLGSSRSGGFSYAGSTDSVNADIVFWNNIAFKGDGNYSTFTLGSSNALTFATPKSITRPSISGASSYNITLFNQTAVAISKSSNVFWLLFGTATISANTLSIDWASTPIRLPGQSSGDTYRSMALNSEGLMMAKTSTSVAYLPVSGVGKDATVSTSRSVSGLGTVSGLSQIVFDDNVLVLVSGNTYTWKSYSFLASTRAALLIKSTTTTQRRPRSVYGSSRQFSFSKMVLYNALAFGVYYFNVPRISNSQPGGRFFDFYAGTYSYEIYTAVLAGSRPVGFSTTEQYLISPLQINAKDITGFRVQSFDKDDTLISSATASRGVKGEEVEYVGTDVYYFTRYILAAPTSVSVQVNLGLDTSKMAITIRSYSGRVDNDSYFKIEAITGGGALPGDPVSPGPATNNLVIGDLPEQPNLVLTDRFLLDRANTQYRTPLSAIKAAIDTLFVISALTGVNTLLDTDKLALDRSGNENSITVANFKAAIGVLSSVFDTATAQTSMTDTDKLIINRAGSEYSITFANFKTGLSTGGDPGQSAAQVLAQITAQVKAWARDDDTPIPLTKLSELTAQQIIQSIEHATGDNRLDIQDLKNSPIIPEGATTPATTNQKAGQLFVQKDGATRTLKFLAPGGSPVAVSNRDQISFTLSSNRRYTFNQEGTTVRNYNGFVGKYERKGAVSSYFASIELRGDMINDYGIRSALLNDQFKVAIQQGSGAKGPYLNVRRGSATTTLSGHRYYEFDTVRGPATSVPGTASSTITLHFQTPAGATLNIWPATLPEPDTWVDLAGGGDGETGSPGAIYQATINASLAQGSYTTGTQTLALASSSITSGSGLSVASNRITVATGTTERIYALDTTLEIEPRTFRTGGGSGGNRLFLDFFLTKNGTEIDGSRSTAYVRYNATWTPGVWHHQLDTEVALVGGDYVELKVERMGTYGAGQEVNEWRINSANSQIYINAQDQPTGGGGGGAIPDQSIALSKMAPGTKGKWTKFDDTTGLMVETDGPLDIVDIPKRVSTLVETGAEEGDEVYLIADYDASSIDITPASFISTTLDGQGYGTRGWWSQDSRTGYGTYQVGVLRGTFDNLVLLSDTTVAIDTGSFTPTRLVINDVEYVLTIRTGGTDTTLLNIDNERRVDIYDITGTVPVGDWDKIQLKAGSTVFPQSSTIPKGHYRFNGDDWEAFGADAPAGDLTRPVRVPISELIPNAPNPKNITFDSGNNAANPFTGITSIFYVVGSFSTQYQYIITLPRHSPPGAVPVLLRANGHDYNVFDRVPFQPGSTIARASGRFTTEKIHADDAPSNTNKVVAIDIKTSDGVWLNGTDPEFLPRTITGQDLVDTAGAAKRSVAFPPTPFVGQRVYLTTGQGIRGFGIMETANKTADLSVGFGVSQGSLEGAPANKIVSILSYPGRSTNAALRYKSFVVKDATETKVPRDIWISNVHYSLTATSGIANSYTIDGADGSLLLRNTKYSVQIQFTDNTYLYPDKHYDEGIYQWDGKEWLSTDTSQALDTAGVDARIETWARTDNTDDIPVGKIDTAVDGRIKPFARTGNTTRIPLANTRIVGITQTAYNTLVAASTDESDVLYIITG